MRTALGDALRGEWTPPFDGDHWTACWRAHPPCAASRAADLADAWLTDPRNIEAVAEAYARLLHHIEDAQLDADLEGLA